MILYKYVSFDLAKKILTNSSVRFTQPQYFNDPFDLPAYPEMRSENPVNDIFSRLAVMGKNMAWARNTGILSLTRTPTNPLMWSHYAGEHRGMVIGIDVVRAGLTCETSNLIPAQYGSVIYVSVRPNQPFIDQPKTGLAVGATHHFPREHYEKLQRLFLHKPLCWSYEEEVRVVKCLNGLSAESSETESGKFKINECESGTRHLYTLPQDSIREVYFGFRMDLEAEEMFSNKIKTHYPNASILECNLDNENFSVGSQQYLSIEDLQRDGDI